MSKKQIVSDITEIFIWIFIISCAIGGIYLVWNNWDNVKLQ